jgi:hypothetical protein
MAVTLTDLAEADLKIFQAKRALVHQRERVDRSKGHGRVEDSAKALLLALEVALANLVSSRAIIADELHRRGILRPR